MSSMSCVFLGRGVQVLYVVGVVDRVFVHLLFCECGGVLKCVRKMI